MSPLHGTQCKVSTLPKTVCPMKTQMRFSSWDTTGGAGCACEARASSHGAIPARACWEAGVEVPRRWHNAPAHEPDPPVPVLKWCALRLCQHVCLSVEHLGVILQVQVCTAMVVLGGGCRVELRLLLSACLSISGGHTWSCVSQSDLKVA